MMASPSFTIPQSLLQLMSIELVQNWPGTQMLPEMGAEALLQGHREAGSDGSTTGCYYGDLQTEEPCGGAGRVFQRKQVLACLSRAWWSRREDEDQRPNKRRDF